MFLDEELEEIYRKEGFGEQTSIKLLQTALNRMPKKEEAIKMRPEYFLNKLKQVESGWKLFCKRHSEFEPNGIRNYFVNHVGVSDSVKNFMKW